MNTVTVSPKFQVVIPLAIRDAMRLKPGEKLRVIRYQDRVEMIRVRPIGKMRASFLLDHCGPYSSALGTIVRNL